MSTSLLYHAFGIRGYTYTRTAYVGGTTHFAIDQGGKSLCCSACGSSAVHRRGRTQRKFRTIPVGRKPVVIHFEVPRVYCENCGLTRQVKVEFADERRSYTKAFERFVLELSRLMTIQDVANHLNVGWDLIKDIIKRDLSRRYAKPKLKHLKLIAIDEISVGKGHKYLTLVLDLTTGAVVFVGQGKGADALKPFWKRLRGSGAKIKAVAMDMSPAYQEAVSKHLRKAKIVFDHFHVIKLFNEKLSNLRRHLFHEAEDNQQKVLKGIRWLLLKNPENLDRARNEKRRLIAGLRLNKPLAVAYYMKEDLRQLWSQQNKAQAKQFLKDWIARAEASGIKMLKSFAKTLRDHQKGILAYYNFRISTGPLEGTNNKIKTMKRQAYGYRDQEFLVLKIFAAHESRYELVG
jgi:transposase